MPKLLPQTKLDLLKFEKEGQKLGFVKIAGVDEAGRGPLAGPVAAACCIIKPGLKIAGVNDSKQLTPLRRRLLFDKLTTSPDVVFGVAFVDHKKIDEINIYQATKLAMTKALESLPFDPDYILIDAMPLEFRGIKTKSIIKGDELSQSIAAASIIAKEMRDDLMRQFHLEYPQYGFDEHKGYATQKHRQALLTHGPSPIHRLTFSQTSDNLTQLS